jgi:hypothetical protein
LDKIIRLGDKSGLGGGSSANNQTASDEDEEHGTTMSPNGSHHNASGLNNSSKTTNRRRLLLYDPKSYNVEKAFGPSPSSSATNNLLVTNATVKTANSIIPSTEKATLSSAPLEVSCPNEKETINIANQTEANNITNDSTASTSLNRTASTSDSINTAAGLSTDKSIACGQVQVQRPFTTSHSRDSNSMSLFADDVSMVAGAPPQENRQLNVSVKTILL